MMTFSNVLKLILPASYYIFALYFSIYIFCKNKKALPKFLTIANSAIAIISKIFLVLEALDGTTFIPDLLVPISGVMTLWLWRIGPVPGNHLTQTLLKSFVSSMVAGGFGVSILYFLVKTSDDPVADIAFAAVPWIYGLCIIGGLLITKIKQWIVAHTKDP